MVGTVTERDDFWLDRWLPSARSLAVGVGFALVVAFSALGRHFDLALHHDRIPPEHPWHEPLKELPNRLSSQGVAAVVLILLAFLVAGRLRSLAPLLIAGIAEGLFLMTGVLKVVLAKTSPQLDYLAYWDGGFLTHGAYGMALPSGHATESVLLYGACLLLLHQLAPAFSTRHRHLLCAAWIVGMGITVVTSWLLGFHWASDLGVGLIWGAFLLRCLLLVHRSVAFEVLVVLADDAARSLRARVRRSSVTHEGVRPL